MYKCSAIWFCESAPFQVPSSVKTFPSVVATLFSNRPKRELRGFGEGTWDADHVAALSLLTGGMELCCFADLLVVEQRSPLACREKQLSSQASCVLLEVTCCVSLCKGTSPREQQIWSPAEQLSALHFPKASLWPKKQNVARMRPGAVPQMDCTRYLNNFFGLLVVFSFFSLSLSRVSASCHAGLPT